MLLNHTNQVLTESDCDDSVTQGNKSSNSRSFEHTPSMIVLMNSILNKIVLKLRPPMFLFLRHTPGSEYKRELLHSLLAD